MSGFSFYLKMIIIIAILISIYKNFYKYWNCKIGSCMRIWDYKVIKLMLNILNK